MKTPEKIKVSVELEQPLYEHLEAVRKKEFLSRSAYLRQLVLKEIRQDERS